MEKTCSEYFEDIRDTLAEIRLAVNLVLKSLVYVILSGQLYKSTRYRTHTE